MVIPAQNLIESLISEVNTTNTPSGQKCGMPYYVLMKNNIPVGNLEAKDINLPDLKGKKQNKNQFDLYKSSLNILILRVILLFISNGMGKRWEKLF